MRDSPSQQPEKKNECDPRCRYAPGDFFRILSKRKNILFPVMTCITVILKKTVAIGFYRGRYGRWEVMEGDYDKGFFSGR